MNNPVGLIDPLGLDGFDKTDSAILTVSEALGGLVGMVVGGGGGGAASGGTLAIPGAIEGYALGTAGGAVVGGGLVGLRHWINDGYHFSTSNGENSASGTGGGTTEVSLTPSQQSRLDALRRLAKRKGCVSTPGNVESYGVRLPDCKYKWVCKIKLIDSTIDPPQLQSGSSEIRFDYRE